MRVLYCIWAVLLLAASAAGQTAAPAPSTPASVARQAPEGSTGYTVFVRGAPIGREDVAVQRDAAGNTAIVSQTRLGPPVNLVTRRAEVRYSADNSPQSVLIDA